MKFQNLIFMVLVVQTALVVWLAIKLVGLQSDVAKFSVYQTPTDTSSHHVSVRPAPLPLAQNGLNAAEVRAIIRSELDAFAVDILSSEQKLADNSREMAPIPKPDPAELARLQAEVNGQLDLLHSGVVPSQTELARLEQSLSRLPPGQREEAVKRMFKAVNQGKVDITF